MSIKEIERQVMTANTDREIGLTDNEFWTFIDRLCQKCGTEVMAGVLMDCGVAD